MSNEERLLWGHRGRSTTSGDMSKLGNAVGFLQGLGLDSDTSVITQESKMSYRNMHELLYGKLEYMKSLADQAGPEALRKMAQNSVMSRLFDYDTQTGAFYDKDVDLSTQQDALKAMTAGWYGGDDFFAGLAKEIGVEGIYNPNMSLGFKRQTDNATNHEVGQRYKFGKKSQRGVENASQAALGNDAGALLEAINEDTGYAGNQ